MKITAAVLRSPESPFELETLNLGEPGPNEVLVKLVASGMCHTDLSMREPHRPTPYPVVLGHEGAGRIEALGPGVVGLEVGQPVVLSYTACGSCQRCLIGQPTYCESMWGLNFGCCRPDGSTALSAPGEASSPADQEVVGSHFFGQSSFATHCVAPVSSVVPVDEEAPLELLGPLGCGVQTGAGAVLNVFDPDPGQSLVVFGCGAVGLSAVLAAAAAGCDPIVGVDVHPGRLETALRLGATHVVDGTAADPEGGSAVVGAIMDATTGRGADFAFDAVGASGTLESAVACLAHRGTCGFVAAGGPEQTATISPRHLLSGRTLTGILEGDSVPRVFIPQLIDMHRQGRFPFDELITMFSFAEIAQAEEASRSGEVIKPVLRMP